MKYIGNIVIESGKIETKPLYNVVSSWDDIIEGIPTLIVGWNKTKEIFPETNILSWKIDEKTYWTFGKREKRDEFEKILARYEQLTIREFISSVKYSFFNLLTASATEKEQLNKFIFNDIPKNVLFNEDMVYINECGTKKVIGLSLKDIAYEGKNKKYFFSLFYKTPSINVIDNKKDIPFALKILFKKNMYALVCLY